MGKTILSLNKGRLYYYMGNFFYPLDLPRKEQEKVESAIRIFKINNQALIKSDRSSADFVSYKELVSSFFV